MNLLTGYYLSQLAPSLQASQYGDDVWVQRFVIDSRTVRPGDCFIAIQGDRFDGHAFINAALAQGASAVISERRLETPGAYLKVNNTRQALAQLAAHHRRQQPATVIGLTGSMGKTTTKAMLAAILRQRFQVLAPQASMNNAIGLPLTLLQLQPSDDYALLEMGMNHAGEIADLTQIAAPQVALITCIAAAHLENLHSLDNIAKAKSEIFTGVGKQGQVILNADDDYFPWLQGLTAQYQRYSFGLQPQALVRAESIDQDDQGCPNFKLMLPAESIFIQLAMVGRHHVMNALAAATVAYSQGVDITTIKKGLEQVKPVNQRLCPYPGLHGSLILDDSYSAIPEAVKGALDTLVQLPKAKKIFVFGGMAELKPEEVRLWHQRIGEWAKALHLDALYGIHEPTQASVQAFGKQGLYFNDAAVLIEHLKKHLDSDTVVLVKGSRGVKMERIVAALTA
jgi:UDP-N-acetylmuramoyl-tripeptide--D-alanyl-D-alanine ligase